MQPRTKLDGEEEREGKEVVGMLWSGGGRSLSGSVLESGR